MTNNSRPLPGVTNIPLASIPVGNGYWPPRFWGRWGRTVFIICGIVGCIDLACRLLRPAFQRRNDAATRRIAQVRKRQAESLFLRRVLLTASRADRVAVDAGAFWEEEVTKLIAPIICITALFSALFGTYKLFTTGNTDWMMLIAPAIIFMG